MELADQPRRGSMAQIVEDFEGLTKAILRPYQQRSMSQKSAPLTGMSSMSIEEEKAQREQSVLNQATRAEHT